MPIPAPTIDADLEAVTAALAGLQPRPGRVLLFGSRARGDARPDSDLDLLVVIGEGAERLAQAAEQNPPAEPCGGSRIRKPQLDLRLVTAPCMQELAAWHSLRKDQAWFTESKFMRSVVPGTCQ
jgi:hypothetical protein